MNRNNQQTITIEGKTLEQAIVKAAVTLGVEQNQIEYDVVKKSGGAFFGLFGGGKVVLSAWRKTANNDNGRSSRSSDGNRGNRSDRRGRHDGSARHGRNERSTTADRETRQSRPSRTSTNSAESATPVEPLTEEQILALRAELRSFCSEICTMVVGEPVEVKDSLVDERLVLDINNDAMKAVLTKNTKVAEALEHLLRKKPRHLRQELPFRIFIDAAGNRKNREAELIELARKWSDEVHEMKKPAILDYKSSYDRKIIHMALDQDDRVYTKSIGSGPNRKLMILPAKNQNGAAEVSADQ